MCRECHTLGHTHIPVPLFSETGLLLKYIEPAIDDVHGDEMLTFKPWTIINFNNSSRQWETSRFFTPSLTYFQHSAESSIETRQLAVSMWQNFVVRFLPLYKMLDQRNNEIVKLAREHCNFIHGLTIYLLP